MKTGFDIFIQDKKMKNRLKGKKLAYLGNCASVDRNLKNSFEILFKDSSLNWTCLFSPQHGWDILEQANMIPSADGILHNLPLFSLYTDQTRKITQTQMEYFDVLVIDLQSVGCRVYTFLTTMLYALKSCAESKKSVIILDRPNPVGRVIEGNFLHPEFESVVGAWSIPMRYGMTLGEMARAYQSLEGLEVSLEVILMEDYHPYQGWRDQLWVAPSPNMTDVECALCYSGTVLLEGTHVSEGRGTTWPLKIFGFPQMDSKKILTRMYHLQKDWLKGCILRPCSFKPVFDKFKGEVCSAVQIHVQDVEQFRPYRLISLFLKSLKQVHKEWSWLLLPPYEYEYKKKPIDILSGSSFLREWVEDECSTPQDLERKLLLDEKTWSERSRPFYLY